MKQKF
jgi:hypothetical protein